MFPCPLVFQFACLAVDFSQMNLVDNHCNYRYFFFVCNLCWCSSYHRYFSKLWSMCTIFQVDGTWWMVEVSLLHHPHSGLVPDVWGRWWLSHLQRVYGQFLFPADLAKGFLIDYYNQRLQVVTRGLGYECEVSIYFTQPPVMLVG